MDPQKSAYIRENFRKKTVRELSRDLNLSRKKIEEEIGRLSGKVKTGETAAPAPAAPAEPVSRKQHLIAAGVLLLFTLCLYARTISYPFSNWDDQEYVVDNPDIRSMSSENVHRFFTKSYVGIYAPLTMLSLAGDYQLYHFNAIGYHATNLALHAANAVLLYLILLALTGQWNLALGIALLFAVHPVQPESVVWISQRKNVLSFFLFLSAFLAYIRHYESPKRSLLWYAASFALFVLSCMAKPLSVTLTGILFAYDYCYKRLNAKAFLRYLPFVAISVVFGLISIHIAQSATKGDYIGNSRWVTFLTVMVAMMKYVQLIFVPVNQSILYPFPLYRTIFHPHILLSMAGLAALGFGFFQLWKRDRKLFFWGAWYLVLLAPVLNIIPLLDYMQDRWLYLPVAGIFMIVFTLLQRKTGKGLVNTLMAILVFVYALLNLNRQQVWANPQNLWLETRRVTENVWSSPYYNLGYYYVKQGRLDDAVAEFQKTINRFNLPGAWGGIGTVLSKQGKLDEAIPYFQKALELAPEEPVFYNELGLIYKEKQQYDLALDQYEKSLQRDSANPDTYNNKAVVLALMSRNDEADRVFQQSLGKDPDFAETLINYASFLYKTSRFDESEKYARKFLSLYPNSEYRPLALRLMQNINAAKKTTASLQKSEWKTAQ
ncbi:MAG TPA: tetratricopeptide repeat protein [Verrucomicrobiae bacterium]|jgi:tetratricopeptide (TPR) repeat protein|nr:tetratricopeptide repeat protein [Verrucomicrobiae bacterium]